MSSMGAPKPIHTIHFHLLPQLHIVPYVEGLDGRELARSMPVRNVYHRRSDKYAPYFAILFATLAMEGDCRILSA